MCVLLHIIFILLSKCTKLMHFTIKCRNFSPGGGMPPDPPRGHGVPMEIVSLPMLKTNLRPWFTVFTKQYARPTPAERESVQGTQWQKLQKIGIDQPCSEIK